MLWLFFIKYLTLLLLLSTSEKLFLQGIVSFATPWQSFYNYWVKCLQHKYKVLNWYHIL